MKVDVTQVLMGLNNEGLKNATGSYKCKGCGYEHMPEEATLRSSLMAGLLAKVQSDSGQEGYEKGRLAMHIQDNEEVDLDADTVVMLKKACAFLPPLFIFRIYDLIDPKTDS